MSNKLNISKNEIELEGVREYCEEYPVLLKQNTTTHSFVLDKDVLIDRPVLVGVNEGGYNSVEIDLLDLIEWLKNNKPELLK